MSLSMSCQAKTIYRLNGGLEGPNPLQPFVPLFLIQLTVAIVSTNLLSLALKPFHQPPFVGQLLAGIIIGPSGFGRIRKFKRWLFPNSSFDVLEAMTHLFVCYYAFLIGLKMERRAFSNAAKKVKMVALAGTVIPYGIGHGIGNFVGDRYHGFFIGAALTVTGFPGLSKMIENQDIFHSEIIKTLTAASNITELNSWILLAVAFISTNSTFVVYIFIGSVLLLMCYKVLRHLLSSRQDVQKVMKPLDRSEYYFGLIFAAVSLCGVLTDLIGIHPIMGSFFLGYVIPYDTLRLPFVGKVEDFLLDFMMPMFIVLCGLRTNVDYIIASEGWLKTAPCIAIACLAKPLSSLIVTFKTDIPRKEALVVGLLSNNKSMLALFILEVGRADGVVDEQAYTMMVISILVMTMFTIPATSWYRRKAKRMQYTQKTVQKVAELNEELRIMVCIYDKHNISSSISVLRTSNPTPGCPISIFALQVLELKGHTRPAVISMHSTRKQRPQKPNQALSQTDEIINALYDLRQQHSDGGVLKAQTITGRCHFSSMAEDICTIASDNRATFVIIPFHKLPRPQGKMKKINPYIRGVNEGVLANAPCSVGILFDKRGLGAEMSMSHDAQKIVMLYLGGPDDREALTYALRMVVGNERTLTVVRFVASKELLLQKGKGNVRESSFENSSPGSHHVSLDMETEKERALDDEFLRKFKTVAASNSSIDFNELILDDDNEIIGAMKLMDECGFDMFLVGRGQGTMSSLTEGLANWCKYPELGAIGDILVTSKFKSSFAVLVVKQYVEADEEQVLEHAPSVNNTFKPEINY